MVRNMISEVVDRKINNNFDLIVREIANYCGEEFSEKIIEEAKKVQFIVVKDSGVVKVGNSELYVEDEPVCVKGEEVFIIVPAISICGRNGNVLFVHCLLHALGEEPFIKDGNDAFNETVVDYMAEEICKILKKKGINITIADDPSYTSNSFYSYFFDGIESFYGINKEKVIASRMGKSVEIENVDKCINLFQKRFDDFLERVDNEEKENIVKR